MTIIDTLLGIEQSINTWVFSTSATTKEEVAQMAKVFALRDRFAEETNEVVLHRIQLAGLDIAKQAADLDDLSKKIEGTEKKMSAALGMIDLVSKGIDVVASIVSLFA